MYVYQLTLCIYYSLAKIDVENSFNIDPQFEVSVELPD